MIQVSDNFGYPMAFFVVFCFQSIFFPQLFYFFTSFVSFFPSLTSSTYSLQVLRVTVATNNSQWHSHTRQDFSGRVISPSSENSTWKHTPFTRGRHQCLWIDSKSQFQLPSDAGRPLYYSLVVQIFDAVWFEMLLMVLKGTARRKWRHNETNK